ncbi:uncharacterized protein HaLaN_08409 [Haematococcus lacustris]|uniref:Uncharacterized protein n=1 Tax=Haematococcus lacustris TaxID=44745 RepID=A0A699YS69_HAELA|nr:uncharacterized protein HaLaN_08409 [Haematococcus lacustris]
MGSGLAFQGCQQGRSQPKAAHGVTFKCWSMTCLEHPHWVIVTEDTAIKNAAGAVAKVLSRVGPQGLCCPVFTEKKTDKYTRVVSVAVKAIAVARGYVCNEGTGHEVGFQPYLRHDPSSAWSGSSRPPGAPPCGGQWPGELGDVTQLSGPGSHSGFPPSLTRQTSGLSCRGVPGGDSPVPGLPPSVYGCSPSAASSVSGAEEEGGGHLAEAERSEMAFDVFKMRVQGEYTPQDCMTLRDKPLSGTTAMQLCLSVCECGHGCGGEVRPAGIPNGTLFPHRSPTVQCCVEWGEAVKQGNPSHPPLLLVATRQHCSTVLHSPLGCVLALPRSPWRLRPATTETCR